MSLSYNEFKLAYACSGMITQFHVCVSGLFDDVFLFKEDKIQVLQKLTLTHDSLSQGVCVCACD